MLCFVKRFWGLSLALLALSIILLLWSSALQDLLFSFYMAHVLSYRSDKPLDKPTLNYNLNFCLKTVGCLFSWWFTSQKRVNFLEHWVTWTPCVVSCVSSGTSKHCTAWKVAVFGVFLVRIFSHSDRIFSPNAGKYGPEKLWTPTLLMQHWSSWWFLPLRVCCFAFTALILASFCSCNCL